MDHFLSFIHREKELFTIQSPILQDHFPLSTQDFAAHSQKSDHKDRENAQKQRSPNGYDNHLKRTQSSVSVNGAHSVNGDQKFELKSASSRSSSAHYGSNDQFKMSITNTPPRSAVNINLRNCINVEHVSRIATVKMINLTHRTAQRCSNERQIIQLLAGYLEQQEINSRVQLIPFGSTTYGFGGSSTNLNILINTSKRIMI